jgi:hypothetical protein
LALLGLNKHKAENHLDVSRYIEAQDEAAADEYGERGEGENAPLRASESVQNPEPGSAEGV